MALGTNVVSVAGTPVALNTAGPTSIKVMNMGLTTIYVGTSGAGNQKFPVFPGMPETFTVANTDVMYALSPDGTCRVAVATN